MIDEPSTPSVPFPPSAPSVFEAGENVVKTALDAAVGAIQQRAREMDAPPAAQETPFAGPGLAQSGRSIQNLNDETGRNNSTTKIMVIFANRQLVKGPVTVGGQFTQLQSS